MIRSAPICFADSTPSRPTAPSPTTATVMPGFTLAASAANQPVPRTSDTDSRLGIKSSGGTSGVATRVPSASGTRNMGACASPNEHAVLAARLVTDPAVGTGVIGGEERADDELAGLDRGDGTPDVFDDAAVL